MSSQSIFRGYARMALSVAVLLVVPASAAFAAPAPDAAPVAPDPAPSAPTAAPDPAPQADSAGETDSVVQQPALQRSAPPVSSGDQTAGNQALASTGSAPAAAGGASRPAPTASAAAAASAGPAASSNPAQRSGANSSKRDGRSSAADVTVRHRAEPRVAPGAFPSVSNVSDLLLPAAAVLLLVALAGGSFVVLVARTGGLRGS